MSGGGFHVHGPHDHEVEHAAQHEPDGLAGQLAMITAVIATIGGQVQLVMPNVGAASAHVKAGRLRALAVTSAKRSPLAPDVPTVAESGVPGYEAISIVGIFAPAKTPAAAVHKLSAEIATVLHRPDIRDRFLGTGVESVGSTPEEFAAVIRTDMAKMGKLIRDTGIRE